ncbi:MAG: creatininase family protein [Rhodothermales bacterium]
MPGRPYILKEAVLPQAGAHSWQVAVLPWGATEAHNLHLPYGTDTFQAEHVAAESARKAWEAGTHVTVLPAVPFGVNAQQMAFPLTVNMNPSTQALVLEDIVESLAAHGVPNLVILNGHGGNDFRQMVRELQARTEVFLTVVNWWTVGDANSTFDEPGDHAGELETSVMQHIHPDLVRPLSEAGPGNGRSFRVRALREGWAWAPRDWGQVTDDSGVGNPARATADRGAAYLAQVSDRLSGFFEELAALDPDDLYTSD